MTPITARNIHRHELIGLSVEIVWSSDRQLIGLKGRVIDETKNLLIIEPPVPPFPKNASRRLLIPKKDCIFRFELSSGDFVDVNGSLLRTRNENRIKNIIRKRW